MIQRAVATTAETGRRSDRFLYKRARSIYGIDECHALRKTAGDGRRERAARAVRVPAANAR
jgi:hypothetical protein